MIKRLLLTAVILSIFALSIPSFAQQHSLYSFYKVDSLARVAKPKDALKLNLEIAETARKQQNTAMLVKASIYQMIFQSYLSEDSFDTILVSLKSDIRKAKQPEKSILQSLLAESYWKYYQQNTYKIAQRTYVVGDSTSTIKTWSARKLVEEITQTFLASLKDAKVLQQTEVSILDGVLMGDSNNRLYRPTLYDLLAHRALDIFCNPLLNTTSAVDDQFDFSDEKWFKPQADFLQLAIDPRDSLSFYTQAIQLFKNLIHFHNQNKNQNALADIELKRLRFFNQRNPIKQQENYYQALENLAEKSLQTEIFADILFEQAQIRKSGSLQIDTNKQNLKAAVALAQKIITQFPKSLGAVNAQNIIKTIQKKQLALQIKNVVFANGPSLVKYQYSNLDRIYLRLYSINGDSKKEHKITNKTAYQEFTRKQKPLKQWSVDLPKTDDYQSHTLIDQLEPLPLGAYFFVVQDQSLDTDSTQYAFTTIHSTNLLITSRTTSNGREYHVTDKDGKGIKDVNIKQVHRNRQLQVNQNVKTDGNGFATADQEYLEYAKVWKGADSIKFNIYNRYYKHKDEDDVQPRAILFTDRSIYRPGQKVFFKGILVVEKNGSNQIVTQENVNVDFNDVNSETIKSIKLVSDDFGGFNGSFTIPTGKLNGSMHIETEYGSIFFQVEEYKRPTFEITFDKLDRSYSINDSVKITGTAISYAGYPLTNAKVAFKVFRNAMNMPFHNSQDAFYTPSGYGSKQIAFGERIMNKPGQFEFIFLASAPDKMGNYSYEIEASIADVNGETQIQKHSVNIGKNNLIIQLQTPEILFLKKNTDTLHFATTNLNQEPINATTTVKWQKISPPNRLFNAGNFKAESYTLDSIAFVKKFPQDEYKDELEKSKWPIEETILEEKLTVQKGQGLLHYNNRKLKSGYYKLSLSATNETNDTSSIAKYLIIYDDNPAVIQTNSEWLVAEKTDVLPNESSKFRIAGLKDQTIAFYEIYDHDKIVEKYFLNINTKQTIVEILPKSKITHSYYAVQFTMVNDGKIYTSLQYVNIKDPAQELEVKFLSYRDKLQPGEKETWKLRITDKKGTNAMAEMVATLYDASLEKLKPLKWNTNLSNGFDYSYYLWNSEIALISPYNDFWFLRANGSLSFPIATRSYENIDFFGYNYYGGYNGSYHGYLERISRKQSDTNAVAVKAKLNELKRTGKIYGIVTDSYGQAIPGVSIRFGNLAITTDVMGVYSIKATKGDILTASALGYQTKKITLGGSKLVNILMEAEGGVLNEVVVVGYGTQRKQTMTAASSSQVIRIRGRADGLALEDNTVYNFVSMEGYDPKTGVYMQNGKPVNMPKSIIPRTNFSETAFFYPQLRTDERGDIQIDFTIPQSLTRYKMLGFAHTKDLKTVLVNKTLITQKQLAVGINAPRFLREGDTITLAAKLNNLSGKALSGQVFLELYDALTEQKISPFSSNIKALQTFQIDNQSNTTAQWSLVIPSGINAIKYKIFAESGKYTDGEENTIPVLPNRMLVTESLPINIRGNEQKTFSFDKLLVSDQSQTIKHQSLTFEFTPNPVWYAIQALPYLMEYPYECTEQTFSRFFANSFATKIVNSSPKINEVFKQWQNLPDGKSLLSNLEKSQELKSILLEETPWVREANGESERKKRLATLFDLNTMRYELKNNFEKLKNMQYGNGSFPWFTGMEGNRYITQHIVLGLGQLLKKDVVKSKDFSGYQEMLERAVNYLDEALVADYKQELNNQKEFSSYWMHYLFARSYTNVPNKKADYSKAKAYYLGKLVNWKTFSTYQLAQTALIYHRNGNTAEAKKVIDLLKQTAQHHEELGMYWKDNINGWWWYEQPIETQALLIEAFDEVTGDQKSLEEMKIWLLRNKQTNDWKTTKATVAACYALLFNGTNLLKESQQPEIKIGNIDWNQLSTVPQEAGTGYRKIQVSGESVKPEMGKISIKNNNQTIAWGAMYWQYFEQLDKITPSKTGVQIHKKLFIQQEDQKGAQLIPINTNRLKVGDLVKVRIEIITDRDMEYIHLKDMRSAGFEPTNIISQYKYQDGLGYYESTKDASTNFFISFLRKGTYVFEYSLRVSHSGSFSNGITSLQCMYAPEFVTHSEGVKVSVD